MYISVTEGFVFTVIIFLDGFMADDVLCKAASKLFWIIGLVHVVNKHIVFGALNILMEAQQRIWD